VARAAALAAGGAARAASAARRRGGGGGRDPAALAGLLWDAWRSGAPVAFRDVDAPPGATVPVQVAALEERLGGVTPAEARRLELELVEMG
jgi:hypothetical protein